MTGSLAGEVALVTGATGALGAAICRDLARAGADVAVHHLDEPDAATALARELAAAHGVRTTTVAADVTSWDQVAEAVAVVGRELGTITVLVNNAGFMEPVRIVDSELADWRRTLSVDLDGVFVVTRHVLHGMLQTHGRIVNVSSQLAVKGAVDYVAYATAKAGVLGFTKALAREVGPRVRVNAIAPGPIDTPMVRPYATPEWVHARTRDSVTGRLGTPEEVGPAVVFLAGPGAELLHGQTLHLNGGGVMA
ncbi:SDR family oxidoreductase [Jiangella aurantiaca]|uniref:SDR family oxidoreductase n=1 Tax=Jiangella aurantiaca TaxID=2530373 RepID=A0A4R5A9P0_9ACTN|nr:SDR family oxidoreductase [Jiangella aurantiaca]TDD68973.1 SDR family oxidoreductase [Jiangella aurantiaca]